MIDIIYIHYLHIKYYIWVVKKRPQRQFTFPSCFFSPGKEAELGREMQIRNWAVNDSMTAQPEMDGLTV